MAHVQRMTMVVQFDIKLPEPYDVAHDIMSQTSLWDDEKGSWKTIQAEELYYSIYRQLQLEDAKGYAEEYLLSAVDNGNLQFLSVSTENIA